jgi:hypothetical protein
VAGILAACEGDTIVPPGGGDTTPDITVEVVPDAATLTVGQTRQLVAVISGTTNQGANWETSAPGVATVSATGLVTAVSAGVAVVTAVSQADPTKRDAATITVEIAPAASIVITSITTGNTNTPVNTQNVVGQIDVTAELNVPQGAAVQRVEFLVDNVVQPNCTQTFESGGSTDDPDAAQVPIICSINTASFNSITGAPTFPNGPHSVSAQVVAPNGTVVASSAQPLVFNNPSFITATLAFLEAGTTTAKPCANAGSNARSIGGPGSLWCGGDVRVTVTPVNFGGANDAVASVTVNLATSGDGVSWQSSVCRTTNVLGTDPTIADDDGGAGPGGGPGGDAFPGCPSVTKTATDGTASDGFSVLFSSTSTGGSGVQNIEDIISLTMQSVTVGGQQGPACINPAAGPNPIDTCGVVGGTSDPGEIFFVNPVRLDNLGPRVTLFDLTIPTCNTPANGCYVNGSFAFTAGRDDFYESVDYGVDAQDANTTFQAGSSTSALADVTTAASLDETANANDLFLRVTARDGLGNARNLFPKLNAPTEVQTSSTGAQKFGVDKTAPTLDVDDSPDNNSANDGTDFVVNCLDAATPPAGPSGCPIDPIIVLVEQITPDDTICLDPESGTEIDCDDDTPTATDGDFNIGNPDPTDSDEAGYYRVTIKATDAAGNETATTIILTLLDLIPPVLGGVTAPSTITGNTTVTFSADLDDNIELGDATMYVGYAGAVLLLANPPSSLGTYGPDAFTNSVDAASASVPNFIRGVQTLGQGAFNNAQNATFAVRDMAGVVNEVVCATIPGQNCALTTVDITAAVNAGIAGGQAQANFTANTWTIEADETEVCNQADPDDCDDAGNNDATSTDIEAALTGPTATFANPFVRVNFYARDANGVSHLIGTATAPAQTTDDGTTRTHFFRVTWNVPVGFPVGTYTLIAVGVNSRGDGLRIPLPDGWTIEVDDDQ